VQEVGISEPEDLVVASDTAAQRRHRAHQSRWRRDVLGLPAGAPPARVRATYPTLGNYLPVDHDGQSADSAGWNLMSEPARAYTRARLKALESTNGLAERDRLWRNMLSSQPLAFSLAGHLRAYPAAAARVFAELTGWPVTGFGRLGDAGDPYVLDRIEAEWSPPRDKHTGDKSGFDLAAIVCLPNGTRALVSVEVKYVDTFSPAKLDLVRYAEHLSVAGIATRAASAIVAAGGSQFLRSVLLTESVRRRGIRGETSLECALSVVLGRHDDPLADRAVKAVEEQAPQLATARWSHRDLFDTASRQPELAEWARQMRRRYVPAGA
jgi:hypothetical protein